MSPTMMRGLDCFALPSLAEGVSNTILEAMATGLPIVATRVGGNTELIEPGLTGTLVPWATAGRWHRALLGYFTDGALARRHAPPRVMPPSAATAWREWFRTTVRCTSEPCCRSVWRCRQVLKNTRKWSRAVRVDLLYVGDVRPRVRFAWMHRLRPTPSARRPLSRSPWYARVIHIDGTNAIRYYWL